MLTADLVRAYRRQGELRIRAWKGEARPNAERIARRYVTIAAAHVGKTRGELKEALDDVPVPSRERKVGDGLRKLILDRCEVGVDAEHDPAALRKAVFEAAAQARRKRRARTTEMAIRVSAVASPSRVTRTTIQSVAALRAD